MLCRLLGLALALAALVPPPARALAGDEAEVVVAPAAQPAAAPTRPPVPDGARPAAKPAPEETRAVEAAEAIDGPLHGPGVPGATSSLFAGGYLPRWHGVCPIDR